MSEAALDRQRAMSLAWKRANAERNKAITLSWRQRNPEASIASAKNWKLRNPERNKEISTEWYQNNREKYRAYWSAAESTRKAVRLRRMPQWVEMDAIVAVYEGCPRGMEVDHIVPLQGERVSGLHVPWNLQYLTKSENSKKGNKFECA